MSRWIWIILAWIGIICFSSTSLAGHKCERAFEIVSQTVFHLEPGRSFSEILSFTVEKSVHLVLFAVLAILLSQAHPARSWRLKQTILVGFIVAIGSEYLQHFFPGRDPTLRDVAINLSGFTIGLFVSLTRLKSQMESRHSVRP